MITTHTHTHTHTHTCARIHTHSLGDWCFQFANGMLIKPAFLLVEERLHKPMTNTFTHPNPGRKPTVNLGKRNWRYTPKKKKRYVCAKYRKGKHCQCLYNIPMKDQERAPFQMVVIMLHVTADLLWVEPYTHFAQRFHHNNHRGPCVLLWLHQHSLYTWRNVCFAQFYHFRLE